MPLESEGVTSRPFLLVYDQCQADRKKGLRLDEISVVCEGYDYPKDPYLLRGSCGLTYTLVGQTEVEEYRYPTTYQTGTNHVLRHE